MMQFGSGVQRLPTPTATTKHADDGKGNPLCCLPPAVPFTLAAALHEVDCRHCRRIAGRTAEGKHNLRRDLRRLPRGNRGAYR